MPEVQSLSINCVNQFFSPEKLGTVLLQAQFFGKVRIISVIHTFNRDWLCN